MISFAPFSTVIEPGERTRLIPLGDVRLTTVTFLDIKEESGRSTIRYYEALGGQLDSDSDSDDEEEDDDDEEEKEILFQEDPTVIAHLAPGRVSGEIIPLWFSAED